MSMSTGPTHRHFLCFTGAVVSIMKKYGYVYKITNNINGKIYIEQKKGEKLVENYWGSGKLIVEAVKKYGKDNKDSCFCQKHAEDISGTGTTAFMYSYSFGTTA